ncbi:MAG: Holliday junction resolvase RuvX [Chryseobacterium sp.]|nr:MAG: Holliday junction resolvase RuvX [Chryseobacterium sp.]
MGQIMAIDYGNSRCGIAVTDDMQIIASALTTVETPHLMMFLEKYISENRVETVVLGLPIDMRGNLSEIESDIRLFVADFTRKFPTIKVERQDERLTSRTASQIISQSGKGKKERQRKGLIDKVSATLILQNFLERQ